jgi:hypothetical protein
MSLQNRTKRHIPGRSSAEAVVKPGSAVSDGDANASQKLADEPLRPESGLASNIAESKVDPTASSTRAEDLRLKDLWDEAYNLLWNDKDKKKLIDAYEKFLQNLQSSQDSLQLGTLA